jgi:hypothetical protein
MNQNIKTLLLAIATIFATTVTNAQANVGIGTPTPDASAKLDVTSINQGILVPRMTTAARTGIASPAKGLMVYDSTVKAFYYHDGTGWGAVGADLPAQTGNSGKYLTTDGTNASWVAAPGATLQLVATKSSGSQTLSPANGTNTGDLVTFNNVVTTPTSGTYSTSTNTYTATVAGLYYIQVSTRCDDNATPSNTLNQFLYVDVNNNGLGSVNNAISHYTTSGPTNFPAGSKGRGFIGVMLYLNANDAINIKGLSSNSSIAGTALKTDGSCRFMVVKL